MVKQREFIDPQTEYRQQRIIRRISIFAGVMIIALAGRFFQIQVVEGNQYKRRAARQSSRSVVLLPQRGIITDRTGQVLVGNQPGFRLRFFPDVATDPAKTLAFLKKELLFPPTDLEERFKHALARRPFRPETLIELLTRDDVATISARRHEYSELRIQTAPIRRYPYGDLAAHLVGYLGEINDRELENLGDVDLFESGDIIGKLGLEKYFNSILFGSKGGEVFRVDARGREKELLSSRSTQPGWDLVLTLDLPTQLAAEAAMAGKRGAIAALDPDTGEILAIVSEPSFEPEKFIGGINHKDWNALRDDPGHPLEYKPIRGQYPPGSTYKPLVAYAALKEKVIDLKEKIYCPGYYKLGRRTFRCWRAGGHGKVDLHHAMLGSCDTYFYEIGKRLGIEHLAHYARLFGLGSVTGLDLYGEKPGLVPDPAWKKKTGRGKWQAGETIISAIGQGSVLTTPLQMARLYSAFANGGWLVTPHVRKRFVNTYRPAITTPAPIPASTAINAGDIDHRAFHAINTALEAVVHQPGGTGGYARLRSVKVAGKTGTAQVVRQQERKIELSEFLQDHAWFVAYAPAEAPTIAVAVIIENGGHGGSTAAPIARKIIEAYLRL